MAIRYLASEYYRTVCERMFVVTDHESITCDMHEHMRQTLLIIILIYNYNTQVMHKV